MDGSIVFYHDDDDHVVGLQRDTQVKYYSYSTSHIYMLLVRAVKKATL